MNDADLSSLRTYLAERDVACPGCGYNLRGAQDAVCPECGGPVELSIGGASRGQGYLLFLLVVFAWVAASAGMNAARDARAAFEQSNVIAFQTLSFAGGVTVSMGTTGVATRPLVINGTTIRTAPGAAAGPITIRRGGTLGTPALPTPTRNWAQVPWPTWLGLGWWGMLALLGLAGLAIVLWRRARVVREGPGPVIFRGAVALAALHVGFQVFLFVRELR